MNVDLERPENRKSVDTLAVVRNFRQVIEARDIGLMKPELYQFMTLHCGFIAHFDINGFKATYSHPRDFAEVFIRHFDRRHKYFNGIYSCHEEPYKETGYSKAEIKKAFYAVVDAHRDAIITWAKEMIRNERREVYLLLMREFEGEALSVNCQVCGNQYQVKVTKEGQDYNDFGTICCVFCGKQMQLLGR